MKRRVVLTLWLGLVACTAEQPDGGATGAPGSDTNPESYSAVASSDALPASGGAQESRRTVYVDVRTPAEWQAGRIEGAIHIPHTQLAERWAELEAHRDDDIVLYCRTGRRSGIAERILRDAGFEHLRNGGGLSDLQRQGVAVER
jgi:phage shock protein E